MSYEFPRDQFPQLPRGEMVFFRGLEAASRPVDNLTISEYADRYRRVAPESGSPWPGAYVTDRTPYLREPQDCLHPDHPARRVTARWAAQLGKSTAIENWFAYIVDQSPGSMMIVLPSLEEAKKFNRIKLQPTIEATPRLAQKVLPVSSRDEQGSTTSFKKFPGGFCQIVNAGSSKNLQMVSIKYLAMDEVAGYPHDVDGRGSPRDQARARQKMYGDLAKEWQGSTPGLVGECVISDDFKAGDQRYFYVPCPHCNIYQVLTFDKMRGPDREAGLSAHFRCGSCDGVILDGHKPEMLRRGRWIPTRVHDDEPAIPEFIAEADLDDFSCTPCEGRCRGWEPSYHLWAAYAPRERFAGLWTRWLEAEGDTTKMRVFSQQDLAEPYDPGGITIEWEKIVASAKAHTYPRHVVPAKAGLIVSAADVQGYGIKWAVYAIGPRGQRWLIDKDVFEGAPDRLDEPWIALADALGRTYRTANGSEIGIDLSGVDSGFATDRVYRFCASRPKCYAVDGRHGQGLPWLGSAKKVSIRNERKQVVAKTLIWPVGSHDIKTEIMGGLANFVAGPMVDGSWPRSTLMMTSDLCDDDFAKELCGERLVDPDEDMRTATGRRGQRLLSPRAQKTWRPISGRKNDWLDVTVYAFALGWHLEHRMRLKTDAAWAARLLAVHGEETPAEDIDVESGPFAAPVRPQPAPQTTSAARDGGWIPRRKGWFS